MNYPTTFYIYITGDTIGFDMEGAVINDSDYRLSAEMGLYYIAFNTLLLF